MIRDRNIRQIHRILFMRRIVVYLLVLKYVQALKDTYSYNAGNQLISSNGSTYTYDKNGNLISKIDGATTFAYSYDYENRLIKVIKTENGITTIVEFKYDPFGRRIDKKVTESGITTTKRYFYDNEDILFEYDEQGNIGNRYIHGLGIDEPLALTTSQGTYYYHADGLGSIISLTDSSQKVVQDYQYDSFGNLKDQKERIKQLYTFTGREWDKEIGMYFYRARYYDAKIGRFISFDPILHPTNAEHGCGQLKKLSIPSFEAILRKPQNLNPFNYVGNNPIKNIDPFGLYPGFCGNEKNTWVPDHPFGIFDFNEPCKAHDECYGCIGAKQGKSKRKCDFEFFLDMSKLCVKYITFYPTYHLCMEAAIIYSQAVYWGGDEAFNDARENCKCAK